MMLNIVPMRMRLVRSARNAPNRMPFGHDLVALVLEVVLGQPVAVVAELLGPHAHVEQTLLRVPEVLLLVAPAHRRRRPRPGIVDLDATEEEDPYTHDSIMTHVTSRRATPR